MLYITERAVFQLSRAGLVLTEIAPGISVEHDVLPFMDFRPVISGQPEVMDTRIFRAVSMGLGARLPGQSA